MRGVAAALLGALISASAAAGEITTFALEFSRDQIPLDDGSQLEADGIGLRYSEGSALPFILELALGREGVSHVDDPRSLGFQPDGYYIGITLAAASPRWHALQIGADLGYSYHAASQQLNQQQLEIDWRRAEARGWLALHLNDRARLYGCVAASNIDGEQTIGGSTPSRIGFSNQQQRGYCGGMRLEVGDGGYIGLEVESRHQSGGRLYFGRRYGWF